MAKAFAPGVYLFSPRARRASSYPSPNTPTLTLTLNLNLTLILTLTLTCTAAHFGQRQESVPQMLASPPPRQELLAGRDGGVQACHRGVREAVCDHRATARLLGAGGRLGQGHHVLLQRRNQGEDVRQAAVRDSMPQEMRCRNRQRHQRVRSEKPALGDGYGRFGCMLSSRLSSRSGAGPGHGPCLVFVGGAGRVEGAGGGRLVSRVQTCKVA